jgi:hypothetical protein
VCPFGSRESGSHCVGGKGREELDGRKREGNAFCPRKLACAFLSRMPSSPCGYPAFVGPIPSSSICCYDRTACAQELDERTRAVPQPYRITRTTTATDVGRRDCGTATRQI